MNTPSHESDFESDRAPDLNPPPQRELLDSRAEVQDAAFKLLNLAQHTVRCMHHDLAVFGLSQRSVVERLSQILLAQRRARIRLLADNAAWLETQAPRLRALQRQFPHALELRIAHADDPVDIEAGLIVDDRHLLTLQAAVRTMGELWINNAPRAQALIAAFDRRWETAGYNMAVAPLGL